MDGYDADKYKDMVGTGYDSIADAYFENYRVDIPRVVKDKVAKFDAIFDDGSELLELGCGNDLPFTKQLANRHGVIGVDVSAEQIRRAKANVPSASFINADMTSVELPQESFDGVLALYSIIHVPRERHAQLFASIHSWLTQALTALPILRNGWIRTGLGHPCTGVTSPLKSRNGLSGTLASKSSRPISKN